MVFGWLAGCISVLGAHDGTGDTGGGDAAAYDALVNELDARRTEFGGEVVGEMYPAGDTIYWLEYAAWDPTLHSLDTDHGKPVDYAIPLRFDSLNLRVGPDSVAYAEPSGGDVVYHLYASGKPKDELTTVTLPTPNDGTRWYAYANDGTDLYYVVPGNKTTLYRVPAGGQAAVVTTLESAGADIGEFWDFAVDGDTMVFLESGRIWSLDLATNHAEWLGNDEQVGGSVEFDTRGVLFTAYDGSMDVPWYFDATARTLTNVAEQIASASYPVPGASDTAFWYEQDMTRWGDWFVYGGRTGIFVFRPADLAVEPILLEPNRADLRIDYRYPVVTDNGHLFVTGLTSTDGAVGADGPVYEVDLAGILDR